MGDQEAILKVTEAILNVTEAILNVTEAMLDFPEAIQWRRRQNNAYSAQQLFQHLYAFKTPVLIAGDDCSPHPN